MAVAASAGALGLYRRLFFAKRGALRCTLPLSISPSARLLGLTMASAQDCLVDIEHPCSLAMHVVEDRWVRAPPAERKRGVLEARLHICRRGARMRFEQQRHGSGHVRRCHRGPTAIAVAAKLERKCGVHGPARCAGDRA